MDFKDKKILITGGGSGVGMELCRQLSSVTDKLLICGRNLDKLKAAKAAIPDLTFFQCDLSNELGCNQLVDWIKQYHPDLSILVNNAATVHRGGFLETVEIMDKARFEVHTNFMAPLHLIHSLYPVISENERPTVINITTGLVYAPRADYTFYCASKAALHSFTQVLRIQATTKLKVVEVLLPAVDTPWHMGHPPKIAISAERAVKELLAGVRANKDEVKVGAVGKLQLLSRLSPKLALKKINSLAKT